MMLISLLTSFVCNLSSCVCHPNRSLSFPPSPLDGSFLKWQISLHLCPERNPHWGPRRVLFYDRFDDDNRRISFFRSHHVVNDTIGLPIMSNRARWIIKRELKKKSFPLPIKYKSVFLKIEFSNLMTSWNIRILHLALAKSSSIASSPTDSPWAFQCSEHQIELH